MTKDKKHNLNRQSKYQNQIWKRCWNYQTINLKRIMINMLRNLQDKTDNMGNVSTEMKIPRKNQKEMLELKNTKKQGVPL